MSNHNFETLDAMFLMILGLIWTGNLGNMPLIIVPAVCKEKSSPFGDKEICTRNGMAYASLSMAVRHFNFENLRK